MRRADTPRAPSYKGLKPSSERTSAIARSASGKTDSRCEVKLRSLLWRAGARFRKNVSALPGVPDIVFSKAQVVVFCDGDFWHGRNWEARRQKLERGANASYWIAKIERNIERDREHTAQLVALGWTVIRVWESEIHGQPRSVVGQILEALGS